MKIKFNPFILLIILATQYGQGQAVQSLDSIIIKSSRIDLPFKENSRTLNIITSEIIEESPATNLAELLQQEAGIDIRRQGIYGMQSDFCLLYTSDAADE